MIRTTKSKTKHVHLRIVDDNATSVITYCGKVSTDGRYTFKRSHTTCPKCIESYRIKEQTTREKHKCVDDGGFLIGCCKICDKIMDVP